MQASALLAWASNLEGALMNVGMHVCTDDPSRFLSLPPLLWLPFSLTSAGMHSNSFRSKWQAIRMFSQRLARPLGKHHATPLLSAVAPQCKIALSPIAAACRQAHINPLPPLLPTRVALSTPLESLHTPHNLRMSVATWAQASTPQACRTISRATIWSSTTGRIWLLPRTCV